MRSTRANSMGDDSFDPGDVIWAPDPYNESTQGPRPWLVLAADGLPFEGEEYVCAALTLSDHDGNLELGDDWVAGSNPNKTSYCSPWVLATIKHGAVTDPQGRVTVEFTERVIRRSIAYLSGDVSVDDPSGRGS